MNWISHPLTLPGQNIDLISLGQQHFGELEAIAKAKRIWEFYVYDGSNPDKFRDNFTSSLLERERGNQFPFVIFHKGDAKIIGSTRYMDIQPKHRKLEIGSTWLDPAYWGTEVNAECKLLLLMHCFETLKAVRVQLKTDENNVRSRKAIEKIGGQFEGILRNDMIRDDNTNRASASYSIIERDWNDTKVKLAQLYDQRKRANSHL